MIQLKEMLLYELEGDLLQFETIKAAGSHLPFVILAVLRLHSTLMLRLFLWAALVAIVCVLVYGVVSTSSFVALTASLKAPVPVNPKWPKAGQTWTNGLGVKMVPAGTDGVLFSVYDVRLQDFELFADATHLVTSSEHMYGYEVVPNPKVPGHVQSACVVAPDLNWQSPGFFQGPTEPVVGVSWNETQLFCAWLTKMDQREGLIGPDQAYRLPKIAEWNRAAGDSTYSWGNSWPPTAEEGNYCDMAWEKTTHFVGWKVVPVDDGYGFTSPVGNYKPNSFGLYDMGGNVSQFSNEPDPNIAGHKLWRGSSWSSSEKDELSLNYTHNSCGPTYRYNCLGFRIVLDTVAGN